MRTDDPRPTLLRDYSPPAFLIDDVTLEIELDPAETRVHARMKIHRSSKGKSGPLMLDGQKLTLHEVRIDGEKLGPNAFQTDADHLTIHHLPEDAFVLETVTTCSPETNTALQGLYISNGIYCTQCEAEGFQRIAYYLDRPDVMAIFRTRVIADRDLAPVLLSNGNLVASGELENGRHFAEWHDPHPKPSYLFALVAGPLAFVEDKFITMSGREVTLRIYVERGNEDRCFYAMEALKRAMRWDEEVFGREYDLDIFMIVAVSAFNMGAMENKGLNIFNDKYVLARPDTATDADYAAIEAIIAHEYFHNWTGNRITCRDWFQLCLKEGLTVFRDQEFTSDMRSRPVKRIADVRLLRSHQFPEDQGPLAHPVRPDNYIEINNFYTATVYEKGAELVRMIHTLCGPKRFRDGMDLYFSRHDGHAATVEDFLSALSDGAGIDLSQFSRWYSQAGTPEILASGRYDRVRHTYTLKMSQVCTATPGQPLKKPYQIPVTLGLVGPDGKDMLICLEEEQNPAGTTRILNLEERSQTFRFTHVEAKPIPSLLRGFSAPVKLVANLKDRDWVFLMSHDSDPFNRWEAAQRHTSDLLISMVDGLATGGKLQSGNAFAEMVGSLLRNADNDPDFVAQMILLPSEQTVAQLIGKDVDVDAIHRVREHLRLSLAGQLREELRDTYDKMNVEGPYSPNSDDAGRRSLRNTCLAYLSTLPEGVALADAHFRAANNMTDQVAALTALSNIDCPERIAALDQFYEQWKDDHLVMDKWLTIQATSSLPGVIADIKRLMAHPAFTIRNPNKVRALLSSFAMINQVRFHAASGEGYVLVADKVLELDTLNPQAAARLLGAFKSWRQFEPERRELMSRQLDRIAKTEGISRDVFEIASKTLA